MVLIRFLVISYNLNTPVLQNILHSCSWNQKKCSWLILIKRKYEMLKSNVSVLITFLGLHSFSFYFSISTVGTTSILWLSELTTKRKICCWFVKTDNFDLTILYLNGTTICFSFWVCTVYRSCKIGGKSRGGGSGGARRAMPPPIKFSMMLFFCKL